mmetsp:Transcript_32817/g.61019  ORF Transcript_32817/g.61019 Transcript_32817/m.61019 type:complete len:312 (-) Transcript_32817:593-1528(-)
MLTVRCTLRPHRQALFQLFGLRDLSQRGTVTRTPRQGWVDVGHASKPNGETVSPSFAEHRAHSMNVALITRVEKKIATRRTQFDPPEQQVRKIREVWVPIRRVALGFRTAASWCGFRTAWRGFRGCAGFRGCSGFRGIPMVDEEDLSTRILRELLLGVQVKQRTMGSLVILRAHLGRFPAEIRQFSELVRIAVKVQASREESVDRNDDGIIVPAKAKGGEHRRTPERSRQEIERRLFETVWRLFEMAWRFIEISWSRPRRPRPIQEFAVVRISVSRYQRCAINRQLVDPEELSGEVMNHVLDAVGHCGVFF